MLQLANLLEKLSHKLMGWVEDSVIMLPNLLVAALVFTLSVPISRYVRLLCVRVFSRLTSNPPIANIAATLVRGALLIFAASFALQLLQLDKTVTSLLAGVGVVGLALGFAFQDIASNFMSGFMMAMTRPFEVGDLVEIGDHAGRITTMSMRDTEVETVDGRSVLIPNREVFQNAIVNFTRTPSRRLELAIGIDYDEELEGVRQAMIDALDELPGRLATERVEVLFEEFGETTIKAQVLVWLSAADELHYRRSRSLAMIAIKRALDERGVMLPVPARTVELGPEFAQRSIAPAR
ncbi:MAG: mechanosensitive ion channel family protein [Polyangiales bacterium]